MFAINSSVLFVYAAFSMIFICGKISATMASDIEEDIEEFHDLTTVTWAHAVNSKQKLMEAIHDDKIQMVEADIQLGTVQGGNKTKIVPIMAHPPDTVSDLSLEEFLNISKEMLTGGKGIKLDFKSTQVFEASLNLISKLFEEREHEFPVWLNADILSGPGARDVPGVDPNLFLSSCATKFPQTTVSVGWTTKFGTADDRYTSSDIETMTELLNRNCVVQPVTFAVRATFAANSHDPLVALINSSTETATLTIWNSSPDDITDMDALRRLVKDVGKDRTYLDFPLDMYDAFKSSSGNVISKCALVATSTLLAFGNYRMSH